MRGLKHEDDHDDRSQQVPPYQKLILSVDDRACSKVYRVVGKSDLKRRTASLSLLEQRVSVPTARVTMNSMMKILYRVRISRISYLNGSTSRQNRSIAKEVRRPSSGLALRHSSGAWSHLCTVHWLPSSLNALSNNSDLCISPDLAAFFELSLLAIDSYEGINALAIDICVRVPDAIRCIVFPSLAGMRGL